MNFMGFLIGTAPQYHGVTVDQAASGMVERRIQTLRKASAGLQTAANAAHHLGRILLTKRDRRAGDKAQES